MFNWLQIIFVIGSSVTFGGFSSKFLKCYFLRCIHSSWLAAFSLAPPVLFFLLTLFTICYAILDCLFSTESLILLIWFGIVTWNHIIVYKLLVLRRVIWSYTRMLHTVLKQKPTKQQLYTHLPPILQTIHGR